MGAHINISARARLGSFRVFFFNVHFGTLTALRSDWHLLPKLISVCFGKSFGCCLVNSHEYYRERQEEKRGEKDRILQACKDVHQEFQRLFKQMLRGGETANFKPLNHDISSNEEQLESCNFESVAVL